MPYGNFIFSENSPQGVFISFTKIKKLRQIISAAQSRTEVIICIVFLNFYQLYVQFFVY